MCYHHTSQAATCTASSLQKGTLAPFTMQCVHAQGYMPMHSVTCMLTRVQWWVDNMLV